MRKVSLISVIRKPSVQSILPSLAGQFFLLLSGVISANLLGADDRGRMALLVVYVTMLTLFSTMGTPQSLSYYLAKNKTGYKYIVKNIIQLFIFQMMIAYVVYGFFIELYIKPRLPELVPISYILSVSIFGVAVSQYALAFLQGIEEYKKLHIARLIPAGSFCLILVVVFFLVPNVSLELIVICWLIAQLLTGGIIFYVAKEVVPSKSLIKKSNICNDQTSTPTKADLLGFGFKGFLSFYSPIETFKFDQLLVGHFLSVKFLGIYVVAQSFANFPKIVSQGIGLIFFPQITAADKNKKTYIIRESLITTCAVSFSFSVILIIIIPYLLPLLFKSEFLYAIYIGQVLVVGASVYSIRRIISDCVRALGFPMYSSWLELLMIFLYVPLLLMFLSQFDSMGAAYALVMSNFLVLAVSILSLKYLVKKNG